MKCHCSMPCWIVLRKYSHQKHSHQDKQIAISATYPSHVTWIWMDVFLKGPLSLPEHGYNACPSGRCNRFSETWLFQIPQCWSSAISWLVRTQHCHNNTISLYSSLSLMEIPQNDLKLFTGLEQIDWGIYYSGDNICFLWHLGH